MQKNDLQIWQEAYSAFCDLSEVQKDRASVEYERLRNFVQDGEALAKAVSIALTGAETMDGAQEYDDILAGQEIFTGLMEG